MKKPRLQKKVGFKEPPLRNQGLTSVHKAIDAAVKRLEKGAPGDFKYGGRRKKRVEQP